MSIGVLTRLAATIPSKRVWLCMTSNLSAISRHETMFIIVRRRPSLSVFLRKTGTLETSFAEVTESPLAKSVTSWPRLISSSVSRWTISSVPPYATGGTLISNGEIMAIFI